jgi:peptide/nickel transport system substrate-binding protein
MTRLLTRRLLPGALCVLLVLSLSACSLIYRQPADGGGPEQVFRFAPAVVAQSLDAQHYPTQDAVRTVAQQVLEPLVTLEGGEPIPVLAETWEIPDPNTWVFPLREGVAFSDGTPLTAADVVASFERFRQTPLGLPLAAVSSVEATDDATVTIRTSEPVGTLLNTLSLLLIGPADQVGEEGFWEDPVGTGPFEVDEFAPGERVTLVPNTDYGGTPPQLGRVEIVAISSAAERVAALRDGEVDAITGIPPAQVTEIQQTTGVVYEVAPSYTNYLHWFNQAREPFDDVGVRRALRHAVHLDGLVGDLFGNLATVARSPVPQLVFGSAQLEPYAYDPELARQLLTEAGYPDGFQTSLVLPRDGGPMIRELAQGLAGAWAEVGVQVEVLEKDRQEWRADVNGKNWDMTLQTGASITGDADFTFSWLYSCERDQMGYCNQELDDTLAFARSAMDPAQRQSLYQQAAQTIWEDAVGVFPADVANNLAYSDRVRGFRLPPTGSPLFAPISIST